MVLGHCTHCDLTFTDGNVISNTLKLHQLHPVVICPRCGTVVWLGADTQVAFAKTCADREAGRTEIEDDPFDALR